VSKSSSSSGGIGILGLLGVTFVALKLTGVITWSWWCVTMPFWGGFAVIAAICIIILIILGSNSLYKYLKVKNTDII